MKIFIFCIFSLTYLSTTQCMLAYCPSENISPCGCLRPQFSARCDIYCTTKEAIDIKKIFDKVRTSPNEVYTKISIYDAKITELPENATGTLQFEEIAIGDSVNGLQRIHSKAFTSSKDTLTSLYIAAKNIISGPSPYSLVDLANSFSKMQSLIIQSPIDIIQEGDLINLKKLRLAYLAVNAIKGSPFANMTKLNRIALLEGKLNYIASDAFKIGPNDLNDNDERVEFQIELDSNSLHGSSFEAGVFTDPSLKNKKIWLSLANNNITYLNETVFRPFLEKVNYVDTDGYRGNNPLDCDDCRSAWICKELLPQVRSNIRSAKCRDGRELTDCKANFQKCQ